MSILHLVDPIALEIIEAATRRVVENKTRQEAHHYRHTHPLLKPNTGTA